MGYFDFWRKWLLIVSVVVILFGLMLAFLSGTMLFKPMNDQLNAAFWDDTGDITPVMFAYQKFTTGVTGAAMASWGVLVAFVTFYPFKNREKWGWNSLVAALLVWFVVDETLSLYYKVYFNAVFNLGLLLMIALPLFFTRKHFGKSEDLL